MLQIRTNRNGFKTNRVMNESYINKSIDVPELVERYNELDFSSEELRAFSMGERNSVLKELHWLEKPLNKIKPYWRKTYNV